MGEWIVNNIEWIAALFVTVIFSMLNVVIAGCNLCVLKQQKKLQNDSFCYQLFEKRMTIYESIDRIICRVGQDGRVEHSVTDEYLAVSRDVVFWFGSDMVNVRNEIYEIILKLSCLSAKIDANIQSRNPSPDHSEMSNEQFTLHRQLIDKQSELKNCAKQYISFESYKLNPPEKKKKYGRKS